MIEIRIQSRRSGFQELVSNELGVESISEIYSKNRA
jgi:hypothetical protein